MEFVGDWIGCYRNDMVLNKKLTGRQNSISVLLAREGFQEHSIYKGKKQNKKTTTITKRKKKKGKKEKKLL